MKTENICLNDQVFASIFRCSEVEPGVHFFTGNDNSLQVGKQLRPSGEVIRPHRHRPVKIHRDGTLQEVLYIERGKVKVIFYDNQGKEFDARILNSGDLILLMKGGHGFEMLEETVMIEIKQGPYDPDSVERFEEK